MLCQGSVFKVSLELLGQLKNTKIPKVDVKEGKCVHLRFLFLNVLNPTQCKAVTAATAKQF